MKHLGIKVIVHIFILVKVTTALGQLECNLNGKLAGFEYAQNDLKCYCYMKLKCVFYFQVCKLTFGFNIGCELNKILSSN